MTSRRATEEAHAPDEDGIRTDGTAKGRETPVFSVTALSMRQQIVPDEFQGRTAAGYRLVSWGSAPIGAISAGIIGQIAGLRPVFAVAAVLCALACAATPFIDRNAAGVDQPAGEPSG